MARQYKLRLGDGTLLAVDLIGLRAWLHDTDARVQRVGSRRWRTLKDMIEAETAAAAAREKAPRPELPPPPPPKAKERVTPPAAEATESWAPAEPAVKPAPNVPMLPPEALAEPVGAPLAATDAEEEIEIPAEQEIAIPVDQEVAIPVEPEIVKPVLPPAAKTPPPAKTPAPVRAPARTPASDAARAPIPPAARTPIPAPAKTPVPPAPKPAAPPPAVDLAEVARAAAQTVPVKPPAPTPRPAPPGVAPARPAPPRPVSAAPPAVAAMPAAAAPVSRPAPRPLVPLGEEVDLVPLAAIDLGDVARDAVGAPYADFTPPRATRPARPDDVLPIIPLKPLDEDEEEEALEELDLVEEPEHPKLTLPKLPTLPPLPHLPPIAPIAKSLLDTATAWVNRIAPPRPAQPEPVQPPPPLSELPSLRLAPLEEDRSKSRPLPTRKVMIGVAAAAGALAVGAAVVWLSSLGLFTRRAAPATPVPMPTPPPEATAPPVPPELRAAVEQLPHLSPATIQLVASMVEPGPPDPPDVFRRAQLAANRGVSALTPEEAQELRSLRSSALGALRSVDRERVLAYDRVTVGRDLMAGEDARVMRLYARGVRALSAPRRQRLQALLGKAIAAALPRSASAGALPGAASR